MKKLLVIDGNSILNRAFYGVKLLSNKNGLYTNAIFGMINIINKQLEAVKPDYAAVAFDLKAPTFRHKMYDAYKAGRHAMPDELRDQFPYAKHLGAVCVVPLTDKNEVICVKQYRYAHHRMFLEIPAGKLDFVGEDRREAALRELREETGALCESLTHIGDIVPSPAILTERISMYLAEGLTFTETEYDEGEFIEIVRIPLETLVEMIMSGEVEDAKTQTAILKAWHLKNK